VSHVSTIQQAMQTYSTFLQNRNRIPGSSQVDHAHKYIRFRSRDLIAKFGEVRRHRKMYFAELSKREPRQRTDSSVLVRIHDQLFDFVVSAGPACFFDFRCRVRLLIESCILSVASVSSANSASISTASAAAVPSCAVDSASASN
jgi:hypothetical protein